MSRFALVTKQVEELTEALREKVKKLGEAKPAEVVKFYHTVKEGYEALDEARKGLYAEIDKLNKVTVPQAIRDSEQDLIRVPEISRSFYIATKYTASILDKPAAEEWLKKQGGEDLYQRTINAGTLSAFLWAKVRDENVEPPEDVFKLASYDTIGSSKYNPKTK